MISKEIIKAVYALINHSDGAKCEDLHHPKKWRHSYLDVCPAVENLAEQVEIVREFIEQATAGDISEQGE